MQPTPVFKHSVTTDLRAGAQTKTTRRIQMWGYILPINIQALSLYSVCQETDSFTPRSASRSFSSLINFTFVSGLKTEKKITSKYNCCVSELFKTCYQLLFNTRCNVEVIIWYFPLTWNTVCHLFIMCWREMSCHRLHSQVSWNLSLITT